LIILAELRPGAGQRHSEKHQPPRPVNDSWIAACCLARELPLATINTKDDTDYAEHDGLELVR
jgi:predicted nucleic acid-binding protein